MLETQRQPVPQVDTSELDTTMAFLTFARQCIVKKTEGLDDEQLRRVMVPSGTSLLGLVHHVTVGERYWFGYHLVGSPESGEWDFSMEIPAGMSTAEVLAGYETAIRESDAAIRDVGDPQALAGGLVDGERRTLRWVLAHMTSEVARHAGHADILREQIDGVTGR